MKILFTIILSMIFIAFISTSAHAATLNDSIIMESGLAESDSTTILTHSIYYTKGQIIDSDSNINIVAVEYFFDTDPGYEKGILLPVSPDNHVSIKTTIESSHLSPGLHRLFIRAKDESGTWGIVQSKPLFISQKIEPHDSQISASTVENVEYFFDDPPEFGMGNSLEMMSGAEINLTAILDVSHLLQGLHRLYIRAQDETGTWGIVQSKPLFITQKIEPHDSQISASTVENVEYFFDDPPEFGMGNSLEMMSGAEINLTPILDVLHLVPGLHRLHIRAQDETGTWGIVQSRPVFITKHILPDREGKITDVEYFFDDKTALGNGQQLSFHAQNTVSFVGTIDTAILSPGLHRLYVRAKDDFNQWGIVQSRPVYIEMIDDSSPDIIKIEYFFNSDPGQGFGKDLFFESDNYVHIQTNIPVDHLSEGDHRIFFRAQDENNNWSSTKDSYFSILKAPEISMIPDQTILETSGSHCIHFTVADGLINENLTLSAWSSNLSLINAQNILIIQTGSSFEIMLTPVHDTCGLSTITVMAGNQLLTSTTAFNINVPCSLISDVDGDGIIDLKDVLIILQRLVRFPL